MRNEWFEELVKSWDESLHWTGEELAAVVRELVLISEMQGGRILADEDIAADAVRGHAVERVERCLESVVRFHLRRLGHPISVPMYEVPSEDFEAELPYVRATTWRVKLDLNTATAEELAALPGLGPVTAARVLERRQTAGPIKDVDDLLTVEGILAADLERFRRLVYTGPASGQAGVLLGGPALRGLAQQPTFGHYVRFLRATGLILSGDVRSPDKTLTQHIISEIAALREQLQRNPNNPFAPGFGTLASEVRSEETLRRAGEELDRAAAADEAHCAVLEDSSYPYFLLRLLEGATKSIQIVMFFMRFEDAGRYPTDELLAALVSAKRRGLDVRVILDRDAEGQATGSRVINEEAYKFLWTEGVPVLWDTADQSTHTKLVIVDGVHTVVGSHNWTAGSFFAYDDLSLYVRSATLAEVLGKEFHALWEKYKALIA